MFEVFISVLGKSLGKLGGFLLVFAGGFLKGKDYVEKKVLKAKAKHLNSRAGLSDTAVADRLRERIKRKLDRNER